MAAEKGSQEMRKYLGVDVGGTKIQASLVEESGVTLGRERYPTPRDGGPEKVVETIEEAMVNVVENAGIKVDDVTAIGMAIPGVIDPAAGLVVVTPNMSLTGVKIGPRLEKRFKLPVALGNDCNVGALGETWLGSARNTQSSVSILVGTGIGSGIVQNGKLWCGARESAAEIGHIVMQIGGPKCGCGNHGCFEAMASRSAIERDLRQAIDAGRKTVLTELLESDLNLIRSSALRKGLEAKDELVTEVIQRASQVLGHACLTVRHLIDPEVIVLGGGVVEACGDFVLPIVKGIVDADQLAGAREGGHILISSLGDDAVVLGAVALACEHVGRNPFEKKFAVKPEYPELSGAEFGEIIIGDTTHARDVFITVDGVVKNRKKGKAKEIYGTSHKVGPKELKKVCRGGPEVLFVGTGHSGQVELTEDAQRFLDQRAIECRPVKTPQLPAAYNDSAKRKAVLVHVTC